MKLLPLWARLCLLASLAFVLPSFALAAGPTITAQPQPGYVNQGASITLSVTATAGSTITYQWELNSAAIPGANASSLLISNAQSSEAGNYDVVVTAGGVSVRSAIATVSVVVPPSFSSTTSTTVTAVNGQSLYIYPNLSSGTYPLTYSWTKDGVVVPSQQNQQYSDTTTSLSAGSYVLTVTNSAGSATSGSYVVTVVDPLVVSFTSSTVTAAAGSNVTLTPTITGPSPYTYYWYGPNGLYGTSATLTLTSVTQAAAASYTVYVSNAYQYSIAASVQLIVSAPPLINQISGINDTAGSYDNVFVYPIGSGTFTYQWNKDGSPLARTASGNYASSNYLFFYPLMDADAGTYSVTVTSEYGSTTSNSFTVAVTANPNGPTITTQPSSLSVQSGASATFSVAATNGTLSYQWYKDGQIVSGANSATLTIPSVSASDAGNYTVKVTNSYSTITSATAALAVNNGTAPVITGQPQGQTINVGDSITLTAAATGTPAPTFQWQKNGSNIAGANASSLSIANAQTSDSGSYAVVASNTAGSATSSAATITVNALPQTRVTNLSTRAQVGAGANVLIAGFIINGSTSKRMLIRALGPTLSNYSVKNPLADPSLRIVDGAGNTIATNDNWESASNIDDYKAASTQVGAVALPAGSKDAALLTTLAPGGYTALVSGNSGDTGIALVELYEVDTNTSNQLVNISSRADVGTGDAVTIAGIIVSGSVPKKFLVRAIGPGLQARSVPGFLADPTFQIVDSANNVVATNDNWETSSTVDDVKAVTTAIGAVALDAGSKDAALTVTLAPGGYTVIVRGVNGTSGIALVELYQVP